MKRVPRWALATQAGGPGPDIEAELARFKPEEAGERIGSYKLMEKIGVGGFGTVWVAEQERPVRRRVALKIIKLGMDTKEVIARFEQERQALAMMDHPHIAKVFDAGATQWGRPFFVMELVRGIKITDYCDQANLPTADRLALFIQVCNAVQHAHQKGIIHRDLKPSNILVTLHDGVPVPKVIDFGVAKATQQQRLTELTIYTQFQQMVGTPLYMSPEQAEVSGLDVDTRSDIYSLGVLLYELLVGRTPFDPETLMRAGLDEIRRVIREEEPPKPSTALQTMAADARASVAQHRQSDGAKMARLLSGELDWIVMKALEKDRSRRYETANGFAQDIRRYLANEPVTAGAPSMAYLFRKFARRHQMALGLAALIAVVLVAATGISLWQAKLAITAKKETADALGRVEEKKAEVDRKSAEQSAMIAEAARSDRAVAEERLLAGKESEAFAHLARACEYDPLSTLAAEKAAAALNTWQHPLPAAILAGHAGWLRSAQFSPDGAGIVTVSDDKATLWDATTGKGLATLSGHEDRVRSAQFSPDGLRIVTASDDKTARLWDGATGKSLATLSGHQDAVTSAQFSPDGARVVTETFGKPARMWDAATGKSLATLAGHGVQFSSDGLRIVTVTENYWTARIWDAATGKSIATLVGHKDWLSSAQFSPDGTRIVTASRDKTARIWTILPTTAGPPPTWFSDFLRYVAQMRLNSDGELETLKTDDWLALRERMRAVRRASAGQDTSYLRILRRYVPE
ncbi:MAG: eukaryotic-like serine/threonine-protein kinase [Chthoniobacter sp.]|jgi:serine/threonine protein kinase|nr:eukaryotic-like serine/threonine-protein kinase [Chthoniobacter sp.]